MEKDEIKREKELAGKVEGGAACSLTHQGWNEYAEEGFSEHIWQTT